MKAFQSIVIAFIFLLLTPLFCLAFEWTKLKVSTRDPLYGIWGNSASDIYVVGGDSTTILHFDGTRWDDLEVHLPRPAKADTFAVWGSSPSDIFTVGGWLSTGIHKGCILHYDGSEWQTMTDPGNSLRSWVNVLYGVWGSSATDIYAVGERNFSLRTRSWIGPIVHYNGSDWSEADNPRAHTPDSNLYDIWGSGSTTLYAVGVPLRDACEEAVTRCLGRGVVCWEECLKRRTYNYANIIRFDGTSWTNIETGVNATLRGIWGASPDILFAVGDAGTILRYDGAAWSPMRSGTQADLNDVWGFSENNVYAVGEDGVILHYDGAAWTFMDSPSDRDLHAVWGFSADRVYAAGDNGTLLLYAGMFDYSDAPDPPYPSSFARDGARHALTDFVWLGTAVSVEQDALSQTYDSFDDGVDFLGHSVVSGGPYALPYRSGGFGAVSVNVSGGPAEHCYLHGWIDWNADGDWDDDAETVFCGVPVAAPGSYTLEFPIPDEISSSCTWARFRLDWKDNLCAPTGSAGYGEVEDYEICPTLIRLASFTATPGNGHVVLTWTTDSEIDNTGFNLYRSQKSSEGYTRVNKTLISAQGTADRGAVYSYTDTGLTNGTRYYYLLEDIDTTGAATRHGPVSATVGEQSASCNPLPFLRVSAAASAFAQDETTKTVTCAANIVFQNTGSVDARVFWMTTYTDPRRSVWNSLTVPAQGKARGDEPAWGYQRPVAGPMTPWSTTVVTACCSDTPQCEAIEADIADGRLDYPFATIDVSDLNPCK